MSLKKIALSILILSIIIFNNALLFGETLFFSVSPFDTKYGFSFRYDFKFWKFEIDFYTPVDVSFSRGFLKFELKEDNIIKHFTFDEYPYKVTYDSINDIPFTTFINPTIRTWKATWLDAGYYGDNLFYKNKYFSLIGNGNEINATFNLLGFDVFFERIDDNFNVGLGKGIYIFAGEKIGVGINYVGKDILIYALSFLNNENEFKTLFGFTLKANNFEINIGTDDINMSSLFGNIEWKVGDLYVVGRLQRQEVRLAIEFAIW